MIRWSSTDKRRQQMKLGLVSAICDSMTFEEMIDFAAEAGLTCVEVACWPAGKAERRYAGVSHIDVDRVLEDDQYVEYIRNYTKGKRVEISSLAYYPNTMDAVTEKRQTAISHLKNVIRASERLGVNLVTTFLGRDQTKTVEENLELVKEIWPPIIELAEEKKVRIGIENCPMLFGPDQWPGGQNLMTTPAIWRKVFEILPSSFLGLNYDPSHFVWQMIDYIKPLYEFRDKIFHVHYKDIKLYPERLQDVGIMGYPLAFMSPKLPGLGDVDWGKYVSALTDIGYNGYTCIEIEDKAFEGSLDEIKMSVRLSAHYLRNFVAE
jgi:sugar phosphate isomerase/epimerase